MKLVVIALLLVAATARADAPDPVALLPLDADKKLELYGQPVASELAIALHDGGITVVVVGPSMAVPQNARLILDGTITEKGGTITIALRLRDPSTGTTLDTLSASAPALNAIDQAAADLATRIVPTVKGRLAVVHKVDDHPPVKPPPPSTAPAVMLVAVRATIGSGEPLRAALARQLDAWAKPHNREVKEGKITADPAKLVADAKAELGVTFEVTRYSPLSTSVPSALARVRVQIATAKELVFDRVIITDTVVGDAKMAADKLAERVAREVLLILQPHLKKAVPAW